MIIQLEEAKEQLYDLKKKTAELGASIKIEALETEFTELERRINADGFWESAGNRESHEVLKKSKALAEKIKDYRSLESAAVAALELCEMAIEADDSSLTGDIQSETRRIESEYSNQRLNALLGGEYDRNNAILSIHPGAGGTEAQDWAEMLLRMYTRYSEKRGYKFKILDYLEGDGAGLKSVTFSVSGSFAYGYLKGENGVHRLVRISPFDSSGRRHTSFASVEVMPELDDDDDIEIRPEDLKIESHRASGAGGQHINKTDSAVRVTHLPTGIVTGCQSERSQLQNKETALKMLKSRLIEIKERENLEKIEDIKGEKSNIEWGSQIRSYVFMPYTLVSDKRTGFENGNVAAVMDGEIDGFIESYLSQNASG